MFFNNFIFYDYCDLADILDESVLNKCGCLENGCLKQSKSAWILLYTQQRSNGALQSTDILIFRSLPILEGYFVNCVNIL